MNDVIKEMNNSIAINMLEIWKVQENIKSISPLSQMVKLKNFLENLKKFKSALTEKEMTKIKDQAKRMYDRE